MTKEKLILIGGGGHCKSCIDVIEAEDRFEIAGIVDVLEKKGTCVLNYPILWIDEDFPQLAKEYKYFLLTIGQLEDTRLRVKLSEQLTALNVVWPVIISPNAYVSPHASIGEGTVVFHHAVINAGATIGSHCIINTKALVEHDAQVGDYCHISTNATLNGGVAVGKESFVGSGVVSKQYAKVEEKSFIKANSLIK